MNTPKPRIKMYFHCGTCMEKGKTGKDWNTKEHLAVGWTDEGIQIVCETCGKNVIDLDFLGQKVALYKEKSELSS